MEITEVKLHLRNEEKLKAYATITIDDCFVIRDLKVIQGNTGMFISMPSRKKPDGSFKDIAHPLNNETRIMIENRILQAYKDSLAGLKDKNINVEQGKEAKKEAKAVTIDEKMSDLEKNLESKFSNI
ncbi:MAG: septation protein SpoVG [Candidatus Firestonebacteria bacterium RIFOXYC2_FULL_39_67]|nr:MAG: septation protein SpoVG [Candidatus Firestonebacteria bacterium RIFOXYD2_FULL_39_29]OGF56945.1 MAG: septation protein SpoVG [Candidatus Firestonebacteria bacterium RIFOXYC2_FULL_39_67]